MSNLPKLITKVVFTGSKIFGRALYEAGRQAYKNTQYKPEGIAGSEPGSTEAAGNPSSTAGLTRMQRMTLSEAQMILNIKDEDSLEKVKQRYEHLFAANSPPPPPTSEADAPPPPVLTAKEKKAARNAPPLYSHYLQSKVVRALERIEAEKRLAEGGMSQGEGVESAPVAGEAAGEAKTAEGEAKKGEEAKGP